MMRCNVLLLSCALLWSLSSLQVNAKDDNKSEGSSSVVESAFKTTASGLQYKVVKEGAGAKPGPKSKVTVHYVGTLPDGKEFDSSRKRDAKATFGLNHVIKGWTEGVQLMSPGATYKFIIPPELGYGKKGVPGTIPPNTDMHFEVELFEFE